MRITVKDPPKVFDDRKFFREEGLIAFRQPPNSQTTTQFHLRNPQKEALLKMRDTLMSTEEKNFLVVLPTGVGKTLLIALSQECYYRCCQNFAAAVHFLLNL